MECILHSLKPASIIAPATRADRDSSHEHPQPSASGDRSITLSEGSGGGFLR